MSSEKVVPDCRYRHGPLDRQGDVWSLDGYRRVPQESGARHKIAATTQNYVLSLYRCRTCGYVELFDDDDAAL